MRHRRALGVAADRHAVHADAGRDIDDVRVRVVGAARPVAAAHDHERADRPVRVVRHGRRVDRADPMLGDDALGFGAQLGREVDEVVDRDALMAVTRSSDRLRRRVPLAGHGALRHGRLLDRPDRLAGLAIQHEQQALLRRLRERLDRLAVLDRVDEDRRRRDVVVPQRMMRRLEVPAALAGLQIDRDDALAVKIGSGAQARRTCLRKAIRRADTRDRASRRPRSRPRRRRCRSRFSAEPSSQVS